MMRDDQGLPFDGIGSSNDPVAESPQQGCGRKVLRTFIAGETL
jgi:hypothetical protein